MRPPNPPPPPRAWDPLQRAVEDVENVSIYDLVELAEDLVVNPQPYPPAPIPISEA